MVEGLLLFIYFFFSLDLLLCMLSFHVCCWMCAVSFISFEAFRSIYALSNVVLGSLTVNDISYKCDIYFLVHQL